MEYEGGVAEAAGVGEGVEGEEFADGEVVEVEAVVMKTEWVGLRVRMVVQYWARDMHRFHAWILV